MKSNRSGNQIHAITNTNLVFVRSLPLDSATRSEINEFNYSSLPWVKTVYNYNTKFYNGGIKIMTDDNWAGIQRPTYLNTIQQLIIKQWSVIDPDAKVQGLLRTILNLSESDGSMTKADVHHDYTDHWTNQWSALVHLNNNTDGSTDFFTSLIFLNNVMTIPYVPGQVIIFPSVYAHQGQLPSVNKRLTANYIFEVDTKLNEQVYKQ